MADEPSSMRPMGKQTSVIKTEEIKAEMAVKTQEIEANKEIELARLALEAKKLEVQDHDGARNDKTSYARTVLAGLAVLLALGVVTVLTVAAFYYGRDFGFSGFGFGATTAAKPAVSAPVQHVPSALDMPADTDAEK